MIRKIEWNHRGETPNPDVMSNLCSKEQVGVSLVEGKNEVEECSRQGKNMHKINRLERSWLYGETVQSGELQEVRLER